ncbi:MAG: protoporphyrinogen oxidase [Planctomycetaceae bacterium]
MPRRIVVIGGGISGLAAAHHVRELDPDGELQVLEAGERLGGVLQTRQQDGALMEAAADGFLVDPDHAMSLCVRLGLGHELIGTDPLHRHAAVVYRGRLVPIPLGFMVMAPARIAPVLTTPLLSWRAKLRMALEYLIPAGGGADDESLAGFVRRRFGREVYERLVQPLLGGIYAANCEHLSLAAATPRFQQMEREHGSLIRAMRRKARVAATEKAPGARYGQFAALRGGMGTLIQTLARRLPIGSIRTKSSVSTFEPIDQSRWALMVDGHEPERIVADGVIIATPAHQSAPLVSNSDPLLAEYLAAMPYNSCAVVSLVYARGQIADPLVGSGFVVPLVERRLILSGSFASLKYAGRAVDGSVLLWIFLGGGCHAGLMRLPSEELQELAHQEAAALLCIRGRPQSMWVARHELAMPEYRIGHLDLLSAIDARMERHPTLAVAGNAYRGVGLPHCIQGGEAAALRVCRALVGKTDPQLVGAVGTL